MMLIIPWILWGIGLAGIAVLVHDYTNEQSQDNER